MSASDIRDDVGTGPGYRSAHPGYGPPLVLAREKVSATAGLLRPAALFAPRRALTIARAGHWNQCRFPGILGAGGRRAGSFSSEAWRPKVKCVPSSLPSP